MGKTPFGIPILPRFAGHVSLVLLGFVLLFLFIVSIHADSLKSTTFFYICKVFLQMTHFLFSGMDRPLVNGGYRFTPPSIAVLQCPPLKEAGDSKFC